MKPVMMWGSGCEFAGAQLDSHYCLPYEQACPTQDMFLVSQGRTAFRGGSWFLPAQGQRDPPWDPEGSHALGLEEFSRFELLCSGFTQEVNEKFLYKRKNPVTEPLVNINPW